MTFYKNHYLRNYKPNETIETAFKVYFNICLHNFLFEIDKILIQRRLKFLKFNQITNQVKG